jgi:hypothetical protein
MPLPTEIILSAPALLSEIEEFRKFLNNNPRAERAQFLPFFRSHDQLCAFLGTLYDEVSSGTHVKAEFQLWGDFVCDLVAGNVADGAFVLIEFEDAAATSLFRSKPNRRNNIWGQRVDEAVSQVMDWLFRIDSEGPSDQMLRDFGSRRVNTMGLIVVGRSSEVSPYDRERLNWRSRNTIVGGSKVSIITYDDMLAWLDGRAALLRSFTVT